MNKLIIKNLKHTYSDGQAHVNVLKGVNATFESGKMYAIVGESGSGKTTLLSLIAALDNIQDGDIKYNGKSVKTIGEQKFRLKYSNIVFQSFNLIKYMTAQENVEVALDFANKSRLEAGKVLASVGISKTESKRLVQKLSGGQQQRVAIARAIASDTPIIVADEPTGNLDEDTEEKILSIFHDLATKQGKIVILVTHSKKVAGHAHAIVYKMRSGVLTK
ncbi:MAG: ABC transporter ATP-binding protein [Candidatus Nomurabacteria bacterium]|jgi:putative ABC transport system ATP-binding protein|nr:ABC transporter ATP-binding protein [Candidatus Nomurabacteria bacterium]